MEFLEVFVNQLYLFLRLFKIVEICFIRRTVMEVCVTKYFKKVFEKELKQFDINLEEISRKNDNIPTIKNQLKECFYQLLDKNLWQLSYKVFVYEFHKFREKNNYPIDKNSSIAFNTYGFTIILFFII